MAVISSVLILIVLAGDSGGLLGLTLLLGVNLCGVDNTRVTKLGLVLFVFLALARAGNLLLLWFEQMLLVTSLAPEQAKNA